MKSASPSDKVIVKWMVRLRAELTKRYGAVGSCTRHQLAATTTELKTGPTIIPYLAASFVSVSDFEALRAASPDVPWEEVENRTKRLLAQIPRGELTGNHFHESWIAVNGY